MNSDCAYSICEMERGSVYSVITRAFRKRRAMNVKDRMSHVAMESGTET